MPIYAVTYQHPDEIGWQRYLTLHIEWLQDRLQDGSLIASGPFDDGPTKSALLIMNADDYDTLRNIIATDPYAIEGLIDGMVIRAWNPIFGMLNDRSSMPGKMQAR